MIITGFTSLVPAAAGAQPALPTISVARVLQDPAALVEWLVEHSHDVRAAAARVDGAAALLRGSRLRPNPFVNVTLSDVPVGTTNPPKLGFGETAIYGVVGSQTFEIGKRKPRVEGARLRLASGEESTLDVLNDAVADARAAMSRILYVKARQALLQESLDAARQILELQRTRLERGDLSGNDFDRLFIDTETLEADLAQTRADAAAADADCQSAVFAVCDATGADASLPANVSLDVPPQAEWDTRLAERPDVRAFLLLEQSSGQDALLAEHRAIPDPTVSAGFTRDRLVISGDQPRTLQVGVTLPLPVFDRGQHDAARARAAARELHEQGAGLLARARATLGALAERRAAISDALGRLQGDVRERADRVLESTAAAVAQGELGMTDLLLARRTRTELALKILDLRFQGFDADNELRHTLALDAPLIRQLQGAAWPKP
ncbi:MAG: TolC family protein [Vicinamibacterales bacterium]